MMRQNSTIKKQRSNFGVLANPAPEGIPREAVECFIKQVTLQLELAKTLAQTSKFEDALKIHRMLHDRIKELSALGDFCIAQWTDYEDDEKRTAWMADAEATYSESRLTAHVSCRWTPEENALFEEAIKNIDISKRCAATLIAKAVPSKTVPQIRERLRRAKKSLKNKFSTTPSN